MVFSISLNLEITCELTRIRMMAINRGNYSGIATPSLCRIIIISGDVEYKKRVPDDNEMPTNNWLFERKEPENVAKDQRLLCSLC